MKIMDFIKLLRPYQWYKNLLIFLPLFFVGDLFSIDKLSLILLGFIGLCFVSSSNYIINDLTDIKADRLHIERKNRPLASGRVKSWQAIPLAMLCALSAFFIGWILDTRFFYCILGLFVLTQLYSLLLKKEAFVDVLIIGINFVIRASSGAFIIDVKISPWLIIGIFFLSLFLSIGKRQADLIFLGKKAKNHRSAFKVYSRENTTALMIISTTLLIITYTFYSFSSDRPFLIFTLPFALYVIFRYFTFVFTGSAIARHPERAVKDFRIMLGATLWLVSFVLIFYIF